MPLHRRNILGSIFDGTVLGLLVVAFFVAYVSATPVLVGALVAHAVVLAAVRRRLLPGAATDLRTR